jgi:hypothetical protein
MTLRRTLALIAALFSLAAFAGQAQASKTQESMVQDDRMLLNYGSGVQTGALNDLDSLGVDTVHVDISWKTLAPSPNSAKPPKGKDLTNPQNYRASRWAALDLLVRGAQLRGMEVLLTPTAPGPLWGTSCSKADRRRARIKGICKPKATLFGKFVSALGKRYSGTYKDPRDPSPFPLPRLDRWSLYNEPNLNSWLYPATVRSRGKHVPVDAKMYRSIAYSAISALQKSGHKRDQILLGETGPIGGGVSAVAPLRFYEALFCINSRGKRLKGRAAKQLGCPKRIKKLAVTGVAHHPYTRATVGSLTAKPKSGNVSTANLSALRRVLKLGARAGAIPGSAASRIYITEFGVSSRPPAARRYGVSLSQQSARINLAEYLAYRNGAVRSFTQFPLEDDHHGAGSHPAKLVFQSGIRYMATRSQLFGGVLGKPKPSFRAYRNPLFVVNRGRKVTVWGGMRGAKNGSRVKVLRGGKTVKTVSLKNGYFSTTLSKGKGSWQLKFGSRKSRKAKPANVK